eukprot:1973240-Amphidinium_carterae.3
MNGDQPLYVPCATIGFESTACGKVVPCWLRHVFHSEPRHACYHCIKGGDQGENCRSSRSPSGGSKRTCPWYRTRFVFAVAVSHLESCLEMALQEMQPKTTT